MSMLYQFNVRLRIKVMSAYLILSKHVEEYSNSDEYSSNIDVVTSCDSLRVENNSNRHLFDTVFAKPLSFRDLSMVY